MIRSKQVKLNAVLTIRMIKLLMYNELTAHDIVDELGLHIVTVSRYCREMHRAKIAHIVGWEKDSRGRDVTPVWKFGRGQDKPRSVISAAQRQKAYKERKAVRELAQRVAGQFKEAA